MKNGDELRSVEGDLAARRGTHTAWGDTWSLWAVRLGKDTQAALKSNSTETALGGHPLVARITPEVTDAVFEGTFQPPLGSWALVVVPKSTPWAIVLPSNHREVFETMAETKAGDAGSPWLNTGHVDSAGVNYLAVYEQGNKVLHFYSDDAFVGDVGDDEDVEEEDNEELNGEDWEDEDWDDDLDGEDLDEEDWDDEDDENEFLKFETDRYPSDWLEKQPSHVMALQQLLIDLDAYVPHIEFSSDDGLYAVVAELDLPAWIERIDLLELGPRDDHADLDASKRLAIAIDEADPTSVKSALDQGASLSQLPETNHTPLGYTLLHFPYRDADAMEEIVDALLSRGADPSAGGLGCLSPISIALTSANVPVAHLRRVLGKLVEQGADLNSILTDEKHSQPVFDSVLHGNVHGPVAWLLRHLIQHEIVDSSGLNGVLERRKEIFAQLSENVGSEYAEQQRGVFEAIDQLIESARDQGRLSEEDETKAWAHTDHEHRRRNAAGKRISEKMQSLAQRWSGLDEADRGDPNAKFDGYSLDLESVLQLPESIELIPIDAIAWQDTDRHSAAAAAFTSAAYKPAGQFRIGDDHFVEGYVQPFRDLYGMIEQVGGRMYCRTVRMYPGDNFEIATNQPRQLNELVKGFAETWLTTEDDADVVQRLLVRMNEDKPVAVSADEFSNAYADGYAIHRQRLIESLKS